MSIPTRFDWRVKSGRICFVGLRLRVASRFHHNARAKSRLRNEFKESNENPRVAGDDSLLCLNALSFAEMMQRVGVMSTVCDARLGVLTIRRRDE
jgi:hypothetical protein